MPIWVRALSFLIIAPGSIAGWLPFYIAGPNRARLSQLGVAQVIGLLLVTVGWGILLWCFRDFVIKGRGTPAPYDPPRALVTAGLYRFTRNPMYVGLVIANLGFALGFESRAMAIYAAVIWLGFHLRVLIYEEPVLRKSFETDYEAYCARVPRWFPRRLT